MSLAIYNQSNKPKIFIMSKESKPKKKQETHKNSLFTSQQEQEIVDLVENYLLNHGRPINAKPIKNEIMNYCKRKGIILPGKEISDKKTYDILKKHDRLRKLYHQGSKEGEEDLIEEETKGSDEEDLSTSSPKTELVTITKTEYQFLLDRIQFLESSFCSLKSNLHQELELFKAKTMGWFQEITRAPRVYDQSYPSAFDNLTLEEPQDQRDPLDRYFASESDQTPRFEPFFEEK